MKDKDKKRIEDELRIHQERRRLHNGEWITCIPEDSFKDAVLDICNLISVMLYLT